MFKEFASSVETIADNWDEFNPPIDVTGKVLRNHHAYVSTIDSVLDDLERHPSDSRVRELAGRIGVNHGMKVFARYFQHTIVSASQQNVGYDVAVGYLHSEEGLNPLIEIAGHSNDVSVKEEGELCINQDATQTLEHPHQEVYAWKDGRLTHPTLCAVSFNAIYSQELDKETSKKPDVQGCHAEKAHQLRRIGSSILQICETDSRLFPLSYGAWQR